MKKEVINRDQASEFVRIAADCAEYLREETDSSKKKAFVMIAIDEEVSGADGCCMIAGGGKAKLMEMGLATFLLHDKKLLNNVITRIMAEKLMDITEE